MLTIKFRLLLKYFILIIILPIFISSSFNAFVDLPRPGPGEPVVSQEHKGGDGS